jgi:HEAT repeat protein
MTRPSCHQCLTTLLLLAFIVSLPERAVAQSAHATTGCVGTPLTEMSAGRARSLPVAAWAAQAADRTVDPNDEAYENSMSPAGCRRLAVLALGYHGAAAVPVLIRTIRTGLRRPFAVASSVYDSAFARIGMPAVEPLMALLSPPTQPLSPAAVTALAAMDSAALGATQPRLIALVPQLPDSLQLPALVAIAAAGPRTQQRFALLVSLAQSASAPSVRAQALWSLLPFGTAAHAADAAIVAGLSSSTPELREAALVMLTGDAGVPHAEGSPTHPGIGTPDAALPVLLDLLGDSSVGSAASSALSHAWHVPTAGYRRILTERDDRARSSVLWLLASSDPHAPGIDGLVPLVASRISSDTGWVRWNGIGALAHIGPSTTASQSLARTAVLSLMQHPDTETRARAAESLIGLSSDTNAVISTLMTRLESDPVAERSAVRGLVKVGSAATPSLYAALRAPRAETRALALDALGDIRPFLAATTTLMVSALRDSSPLVRNYAAINLANAEAGGRIAIPSLTAALRDPDAEVRRNAAGAIAKIHVSMEGSH